MQLFIDTNILLTFYALNQEDLGEIAKLRDQIITGHVQLLLTQQVLDEFYRNREQRIEGAIKSLYGQTFNPQLPQLCSNYSEAERLRQALQEYEQAHSLLIDKVSEDIKAKNLRADRLLQSLFELGTMLPIDDRRIEQARLRMGIGNPPGKNNSLGDAINWECLMAEVPHGKDLFLISGDKDYISALNEDELNGFLQDEWQRRKGAKVCFYRRLSTFFKEQLPEIALASLRDRDFLVRELANGQSLAATQKIIARLSTYPEFTVTQANGIVAAALSNPRFTWAIAEENVRSFLTDITTKYATYIDPDAMEKLQSLLHAARQ
jgi:predicted nucleic acid-binding protein